MTSTMRTAILAAAALAVLALPAAGATYLTALGQGSFGLVQDGTSNTISFGESTRAAFCFDAVATPGGITDGTSNTIRFGEAGGLSIVPGSILSPAPIGQIADGTSNTIFLGEQPTAFCLGDTAIGDPLAPGDITDGASNTIVVGEDSRFDVCFRDVRVGIQDGTSNTIQFGETVPQRCYLDVRLGDDLAVAAASTVPAPNSLVLLLAGLVAIGLWQQASRD